MQQAEAIGHYRKPLSAWDAESWIRSKPTRNGSCDGLAFPPQLVPLSRQSRFSDDAALRAKLLAFRLLTHLQFTTVLELEHVNLVCSKLARGVYPLDLNREQMNDALRIYCDEGGHALFVELLSDQVERCHEIERGVLPRPRFDQTLQRMFEKHRTDLDVHMLHLFFVAVSETLVSKILREIPFDREVAPAVREVIADHARDEGTHSVYFHWLFPRAWSRLPRAKQEIIGRILPEFVWAFLAPDTACDARVLSALGFNESESRKLLDDTYVPDQVARGVRASAQPTLRMFDSAGVLELPSVAEAFAERELYLEVS